jgi:N-methylhydantoinase A
LYGFGGNLVTVTDANAFLGRISAEYFLGGGMALYPDLIQEPLSQLAQGLNLSPHRAALGILEITNANIERAIRTVSIGQGYDPRDFTIIAFGGAGPLHVCEVAQRLAIPRVIIPHQPGVLCAQGLLMADLIVEETTAVLSKLTPDTKQFLENKFRKTEQAANATLEQEGIPKSEITLNRLIDARYLGQSFELTIPYSSDLEETFHEAHQERYGYRFSERTVEIVNLRLQAIGKIKKPTWEPEPEGHADSALASVGKQTTFDKDLGTIPIHLYERKELHPGAVIAGAALVFQMDSTTYIPPNWEAVVVRFRNLILEHKR